MKKILLIVLIILLATLTYFSIANGLEVGNIQILSVSQIQEKNESLDISIEKLNSAITKEFPKKISEVKTATEALQKTKKAYLDKTTSYTDEQILSATQEEKYDIEFLWTRVGQHATEKGVNIKMDIKAGDTEDVKDLNFTVQGSYIGITDFIYAVEEDEDLNFRVKNFKMLPNKGEILKATFLVKNIKILGNTSSATVNSTSTQSNNTNTNENSNTTEETARNVSSNTESNSISNTESNTISNTESNTTTN